MTNTQRTDERCHDCLRPLDGQNCSAGGVHDLPTTTDESVVDWEKEFEEQFTNNGTIWNRGRVELTLEPIKSFIRSLLTSQSIKHKTEVEKAREEERESIKDWVTTILFAHPELKDEIISFLNNKES